MIPFLVVDRPASLRIVKGACLTGRVGLMSHANTTKNFQRLFRDYPCGENPCHAIDPGGAQNCHVAFDGDQCDVAQKIRGQTIKMCDCGMFTKEGAHFSYKELFDIYDGMGAGYGIMLDVFRDRAATVESARKALETYDQQDYNFKLVLVAQGETVEEYLHCYEQLLNLGNDHIAVGGLLRRKVKTARFVEVRSEDLMEEVLGKIREEFDPKWLFALGCYHRERHKMFRDLGVWGSDYKGWIFKYKKRERLIQENWKIISDRLEEDHNTSEYQDLTESFKTLVEKRSEALMKQEKSEYKTSRRNLPIDDRTETLVKMDKQLGDLLNKLTMDIELDGSSELVRQKKVLIEELTNSTEQQIRFRQVRAKLKTIENEFQE
jgi:hypothetical protein